MSHSYVSALFHRVFSTKDRRKTIGISQIDDTKRYIANQHEHHKTKTFQEEYLAFPEIYGIEYDPRYVWG